MNVRSTKSSAEIGSKSTDWTAKKPAASAIALTLIRKSLPGVIAIVVTKGIPDVVLETDAVVAELWDDRADASVDAPVAGEEIAGDVALPIVETAVDGEEAAPAEPD